MKLLFLLFTIYLLSTDLIGQQLPSLDAIETKILSKNDFDISIIQVFPHEFPKVSVVFQAKNELGEPLWLLTKNDFLVFENAYTCKIMNVRNISKNKPVNLALVFDHSGSMIENPEHMTDTSISYQDLYFYGTLPEGYVMSIEYAQEAILNFFNVENQVGDSMFFVGFSETVDKIAPLTNDFNRFENIVKNVKPGGSTAFYDAVYNAIDSLKNHSSQPAVIALTDGGDNSSVYKYDELIDFANKYKVPIYIIGLGNVNSSILKYICDNSNGFYYHTKDPSKLTEIYKNIKKQLRSIYELDYLSNEDNSDDPLRRMEFNFTNDTLSFNYHEYEFELPEEVVEHLETRHEELRKQAELKRNILIGGTIFGVFLLGLGSFVVTRRKRQKLAPHLIKIFPNPFSDQLNISYNIPNAESGTLLISKISGGVVRKMQINAQKSDHQLNLTDLESGTYLISIKTDSAISNVLKVIKN